MKIHLAFPSDDFYPLFLNWMHVSVKCLVGVNQKKIESLLALELKNRGNLIFKKKTLHESLE
jgi:hypothetical protein